MSIAIDAVYDGVQPQASPLRAPIRIALLGVGQVGGALVELLQEPALSSRFALASCLVRDLERPRPHAQKIPLTATVRHALGGNPDVVVEALGGLEPARTLLADAIGRGIPVVTANKSLLAAHGDELLNAAKQAGVPFRYEAAVLAGVPFLGTFARRRLARDVTGFCGIVNGTTNFVLSQMHEHRVEFGAALDEARRRGYAEPDPTSDVTGVDAAEKLCVLLRHFGGWSVAPAAVHAAGLDGIQRNDMGAALQFDGVIKPVVQADWQSDELSAFSGPAFVPLSHPLAQVSGVRNAVSLRNRTAGDLLFAGAGAGPTVTAATLLDDAAEAVRDDRQPRPCRPWKFATPLQPATGWFIRVSGEPLPDPPAIANLLSPYGICLRRTSEPAPNGAGGLWLLTHRCTDAQIEDGLTALGSAVPCRTFRVRVLES